MPALRPVECSMKTLRPLLAMLRELGVGYIDDLLIMADSPEKARGPHSRALLENVVHPRKAAFPRNRISGHECSHPLDGTPPPWTENEEAARRGEQTSVRTRMSLSPSSVSSSGKDECSIPGSASCAIVLQADPKLALV